MCDSTEAEGSLRHLKGQHLQGLQHGGHRAPEIGSVLYVFGEALEHSVRSFFVCWRRGGSHISCIKGVLETKLLCTVVFHLWLLVVLSSLASLVMVMVLFCCEGSA